MRSSVQRRTDETDQIHRRADPGDRHGRRSRSEGAGSTGAGQFGVCDHDLDLALNLTVGGLNVFAVEQMTGVVGGWGRIVWMPTFDAENQVRYSKETRPSVSVARDDALLPETKAVISAVARHQLTLATGHLSPAEGLLVLAEAQRQGVRRMLVTHATTAPVLMNLEQMKQAIGLGAYIELVGGSVTPAAAGRLDALAVTIRQVGPQFCILSSDLGRKGNPLPTDGLACWARPISSGIAVFVAWLTRLRIRL
jgi:hypothetical protein